MTRREALTKVIMWTIVMLLALSIIITIIVKIDKAINN